MGKDAWIFQEDAIVSGNHPLNKAGLLGEDAIVSGNHYLNKAGLLGEDAIVSVQHFIGIDVGTQGARVVLMDANGHQHGIYEEPFPLSREEQSPEDWWNACLRCLQTLAAAHDLQQVTAISVTSTSGTIIPLGKDLQPLHHAIMYSDTRQEAEAMICKDAALQHHPNGYTAFNTSSGLPKMLWFLRHYKEQADRLYKFIHAADFITGRLCGRFDLTDPANALKSGYDIDLLQWPAYIWERLPIKKEWLQQVIPSGTPIAPISPIHGLPAHIMVTAGITDGCASQIASGAVHPGDWNTTIGTTLVVKGVTTQAIRDPKGRLYNHRHPDGLWMPGGASNTGADWITQYFPNEDLVTLSQAAEALTPTRRLSWPLTVDGERFPFVAPLARGFEDDDMPPALRFAAGMEGVAYIEKYAYDMIRQLSGETVKAIYTAGGGSNSDLWLHIRSNVLELPVYKMEYATGAVGAAILAASKTSFDSVVAAADAMTRVEKAILPRADLSSSYQNDYKKFIRTLKEKGYISGYEQP